MMTLAFRHMEWLIDSSGEDAGRRLLSHVYASCSCKAGRSAKYFYHHPVPFARAEVV